MQGVGSIHASCFRCPGLNVLIREYLCPRWTVYRFVAEQRTNGELSSHGPQSFLVLSLVYICPYVGSFNDSGERASVNTWCPRFDGRARRKVLKIDCACGATL